MTFLHLWRALSENSENSEHSEGSERLVSRGIMANFAGRLGRAMPGTCIIPHYLNQSGLS